MGQGVLGHSVTTAVGVGSGKGESLETSAPLGVSRGRERLVPQPPDVGW